MTLIQILWNYAFESYHYGKKEADKSLRDFGLDNKVIRLIQLSVDDDGNFLQDHNEDGDYTFIPISWKNDLYRPNDSKRPILKAQTDVRYS